jgi:hypothetical protein
LNQDLGFGNAAERASARASNKDLNLSRPGSALTLRWLLYTNEEFAVPSLDNPFSRYLSFFDIILHDSDTLALLPVAERGGFERSSPSAWAVKALKVRSYLTAPFDVSIFLDFDSRPCSKSFALGLIGYLGDADVIMTNKYSQPGEKEGLAHWLEEHNSAVVVMNSNSSRTRLMTRIYAEAELKLHPEVMDQPAFMIALRATAFPFSGNLDSSGIPRRELPPAQVVDQVLGAGGVGLLRHRDFPTSAVCRAKISTSVSCDDGCSVVHKPMKVGNV